MQIYVREGEFFRLVGIFETHAAEINGTVCYVGYGIFRVGEGRLLGKYFVQAFHGFRRHGEHDVNHGQHHQLHENLHAIGEHGGDFTHVDKTAAGGDDEFGANQQYKYHVEIHAELHERRVECHQAFGEGEVLANGFGGGGEFLLFIRFSGKTFHHPHVSYVLFDGFVETVVFAEHAAESRHGFARHQQQPARQDGHQNQERGRQSTPHDVSHDNGKNQHQGCAHGDANEHHVRHAHVHDVGGQPRHQGRGGEAVDVLERIALDVIKRIPAQVFRKAGRGFGTGDSR